MLDGSARVPGCEGWRGEFGLRGNYAQSTGARFRPSDGAQPPRAALEARQITKRFPGVLANDRIDLLLKHGEVHALLGENGSGKTTLCNILTGLYRQDEGDVAVDGQVVTYHSQADAHRHGVFMVHQHFTLVESLSVAENVMLGRSG